MLLETFLQVVSGDVPLTTALLYTLYSVVSVLLIFPVHECAHGLGALIMGDKTAKYQGRLTLNPLKHLDPLGTIMMLVVGFGWAKPVPVNPRNFRNYRQDDLKVSLAGVTMNLMLFIISMLAMFACAALALSKIPVGSLAELGGRVARGNYGGQDCLFVLDQGEYYYVPLRSLLNMLPYAGDYLIAPVFGEIPGYLSQMLGYFAMTNLVLCLFNLIPVPPLDGYHVLNDLVLRRNLFANPRTAQITHSLLFVLVMTGVVGRGLGWLDTRILTGAGSLAAAALRAMGLMG